MPAPLRLNKKELVELIEATEEGGGDAGELKTLLAQVDGDTPPKPKPAREFSINDEPTTEERLEYEAGYLFPVGVTGDILNQLVEFDRSHNLKELKTMCVEAGLSPNGHKKLLAAKLIAYQGRQS